MGRISQAGSPRTPDELEAVADLAKALTSTLDLGQVLDRIMEHLTQLLRPERWSLYLADEDGERLRCEVAVGPGSDALLGTGLDFGHGLVGRVAADGRPVLVSEGAPGDRSPSVLAVPLGVREGILGVIELVAAGGDPAWDEDDLRVLTWLADFAAIAIDNARTHAVVQDLTVRDEHTRLYNARYLRRTLAMEVERTRRYHHPVSVVFLDLDHFKSVNDAHGHTVGSTVLDEVGSVLMEQCRTTDVVCRYGGDEFVVVLPETDRAEAFEVAERLRTALAEARCHGGRSLSLAVTASVGVATYPDDADGAADLLRQADLAMYVAKSEGRNRTRRAGALG